MSNTTKKTIKMRNNIDIHDKSVSREHPCPLNVSCHSPDTDDVPDTDRRAIEGHEETLKKKEGKKLF